MARTPVIDPALYSKTRSSIVQADEWNTGVNEVNRLGRDKLSRKGDTVTGTLTVRGLAQTEPLARLDVEVLDVDGTVTMPAGALSIRSLGLVAVDVNFSIDEGKHAQFVVERHPIDAVPPFGAFLRIKRTSRTISIGDDVVVSRRIGATDYIERRIGIGCPVQAGVTGKATVAALLFAFPVPGFTPELL